MDFMESIDLLMMEQVLLQELQHLICLVGAVPEMIPEGKDGMIYL